MPNASGPSTTITRRFMILQASCGCWRAWLSAARGPSSKSKDGQGDLNVATKPRLPSPAPIYGNSRLCGHVPSNAELVGRPTTLQDADPRKNASLSDSSLKNEDRAMYPSLNLFQEGFCGKPRMAGGNF